jgi:hypothetical protein
MVFSPDPIRAPGAESSGMHTGIVRLIAFMFLLLSSESAFSCEQCGRGPALDPTGIGWQQVELRARKFLIAAKAVVEWSVLDVSNANVGWIDADGLDGVEGELIEPGAQILRLDYSSKLIGKPVNSVLWMDPSDGAILQYSVDDNRRRPKHRTYRFTNRGAFRRTWRPEKNEKKLAWPEWSEQYGDFRPFPEEVYDRVITDSLGIIYIIAASELGRGGDRLEVLAFGSREVSRGIFTAEEIVDIDADFVVEGPSGEERCKGKTQVLRIGVEIETVGDEDEPDSGILSEIEIFLDLQSRLPLRISARAKFVGRVVIQTKRARMIDNRGCPLSMQSKAPRSSK